jgi:hypothetical protein
VLTSLRARLRDRPLEYLALALIVGFGAWTRVSGFSHGDPWFDDAWVVLSSKVPLGTAVHMVNTTPVFSLLMRWWILLKPGALWWAQLPVFVLGLGTIVAVFALLRYFAMWWPLAYLGALVIAVSPIAVAYSTRVKQYNLDILLACAVLWLFERWRRDPDRTRAVALAVTGAGALLVSAATMVVTIPACVAVAHAMAVERRRRADGAIVLGSVAVVGAGEYLEWLRHLSHGLDVGWTHRGYMLTFKSAQLFKFSLETMGTQLFHWMLDVPIGHQPDPSKAVTRAGEIIAAITAALLISVTAPVLIGAARRLRQVVGPLVVPAGAVVLAALLGLLAISPFGGGRTDEVFYPALLLVFAGAVSWLARRWRPLVSVLLVGALAAAGSCVMVGARNRAQYPTIDLRGLYAKFGPHVGPYQFVVIDPWLSFTWADDGLSRTSVSLVQSFPFGWSQGFHVVSDDNKVIISDQYFFPSGEYGGLSHFLNALWYVGETGGPTWPVPGPQDKLYQTRNYVALLDDGWVPTTTVYHATHTIAILMKYEPTKTASGG